MANNAPQIPQLNQPAQTPGKPQLRAYPIFLYRMLIYGTLTMALGGLYDYVKTHTNPDNRNAEEMSKDVLEERRRLDPKRTGTVSDELVKSVAKDATCLLKLMNFEESEAPEIPVEPDKPKAKMTEDPRAWIKYEKDKHNYEYLTKTYDSRKKLWEENQKTRSEYVVLHLKDGAQNIRFSYHPNLFNYVADERFDYQVQVLYDLVFQTKYWEGQLGWLKTGFEEYKSRPGNEGLDKKEAWRKYVVEAYLGRPLTCPRWVSGECMRTWEGTTTEDGQELKEALKNKDEEAARAIRNRGRVCLLLEDVANGVTRANRRKFDDGRGEIYPETCFRNVRNQASLVVAITGGGCNLAEEGDDVNNPGFSNHGTGTAIDDSGYAEDEPYLANEAGMQCDFVSRKDRSHCSVGERALSEKSIFDKRVADAKANKEDIKEIIKGGWDALRGR